MTMETLISSGFLHFCWSPESKKLVIFGETNGAGFIINPTCQWHGPKCPKCLGRCQVTASIYMVFLNRTSWYRTCIYHTLDGLWCYGNLWNMVCGFGSRTHRDHVSVALDHYCDLSLIVAQLRRFIPCPWLQIETRPWPSNFHRFRWRENLYRTCLRCKGQKHGLLMFDVLYQVNPS